MKDKIFLDTNLWIYLYAKNPLEKYQQVAEIIKNNYSFLLVSTQVLGELFHVLTRKKWEHPLLEDIQILGENNREKKCG